MNEAPSIRFFQPNMSNFRFHRATKFTNQWPIFVVGSDQWQEQIHMDRWKHIWLPQLGSGRAQWARKVHWNGQWRALLWRLGSEILWWDMEFHLWNWFYLSRYNYNGAQKMSWQVGLFGSNQCLLQGKAMLVRIIRAVLRALCRWLYFFDLASGRGFYFS